MSAPKTIRDAVMASATSVFGVMAFVIATMGPTRYIVVSSSRGDQALRSLSKLSHINCDRPRRCKKNQRGGSCSVCSQKKNPVMDHPCASAWHLAGKICLTHQKPIFSFSTCQFVVAWLYFFSLIANFICKTGDSSISTSITTTNITTTGSTSIVTRPYPSKPTGNCDLEDVLCSDGTCVPLSRQCDRVRDCPDGADEIACGNFFFFFAFTLPLFHFFSFF